MVKPTLTDIEKMIWIDHDRLSEYDDPEIQSRIIEHIQELTMLWGKTGKTAEEYETEIKDMYERLKTCTNASECQVLESQLYTLVGSWEKKLLKIADRANNEQNGLTITELQTGRYDQKTKRHVFMNWLVSDMETKANSKFDQTTDYVTDVVGGSVSTTCEVFVERKGGLKAKNGTPGNGGADDLYQTLSSKDSRKRFYRENDRAEFDPRCKIKIVLAECSLQDYDGFSPKFIGNKYNRSRISMSVPARDATIAGLFVREFPVLFAGSRTKAVIMYRNLVRQWIIQNFVEILGLEKPKEDLLVSLKEKEKLLVMQLKLTRKEIRNCEKQMCVVEVSQ